MVGLLVKPMGQKKTTNSDKSLAFWIKRESEIATVEKKQGSTQQ